MAYNTHTYAQASMTAFGISMQPVSPPNMTGTQLQFTEQ